MPLYLFLFRKGVEGFDLCPASQLAAWENGLAGTPGLGAYEVRHSSDSGGTHIDLEPLRAARPVQVRQGSYTFSYYLGLPRITEKSNRKWRHLSFGNHPWPSDEEIRRWAENGVNLVRLHNDYSEDGVFWHAASWPPYDAKGMAEMRRVIAACHRHKILIVPYFSLLSFHPESEGYEEHAKVWSRTTDELGTVVHSRVGKGEYGAQMCLRSNWIERRKRDIEKAYRELGFDGIYYDSVNSFLCRNRQHSTSLHSTIDGLVEILAWTRRLIAPHGVLVVHSYVPFTSIVLENFGDALVNMEHLSLSKETLKLQDVPTVSLQAEGVPRLPCPSYVEDRIVERNQNNIAQFVVLGMFPGYRATGPSIAGAGGPAYDLTLQLFRAFKAYRLEDYRFHNAFSGAVRTAWEDVYGAVYEGADPTLVVLSNTGSEPRRKVSWRLNPAIFGRDAPSRLTVKDVKSGSIQTIGPAALVDGSLETGLQPYEYRLFEIRAAR